jgi:peptidyl-prolyl cis-trans isomerase C
MARKIYSHSLSTLFVGVALLFLAACKPSAPVQPAPTQAPPTPAASPTASVPSPTPAPLAARVNGEGILLEDYDAELVRYQAVNTAASTSAATPVAAPQQAVIDDLVNLRLLAQAAVEGGYKVDDAALQTRLDALASQAGGVPALQDWMKRNSYNDVSFKRALRVSMLAAWERDQVIAKVPQAVEQVHARQILVQGADLADKLEGQLKNGSDFATLASQYDSKTGGELGWFPRGYLTQPEVEQAAFELQPNGISPVIKSAIGFHILQVIERDPKRALDPDARRVFQEKALRDWLQQHRSEGKIEVLVK